MYRIGIDYGLKKAVVQGGHEIGHSGENTDFTDEVKSVAIN